MNWTKEGLLMVESRSLPMRELQPECHSEEIDEAYTFVHISK